MPVLKRVLSFAAVLTLVLAVHRTGAARSFGTAQTKPLTFRVVDSRGRPISAAVVEIGNSDKMISQGGWCPTWARMLFTDLTGIVRFDLGPNTLFEYRVMASGFEGIPTTLVTDSSAQDEIEVKLQSSASPERVTARGRVLSASKQPMEGVLVRVGECRGMEVISKEGTRATSRSHEFRSTHDLSVTTGKDGSFRLPVPPGRWVVEVIRPTDWYRKSVEVTTPHAPELVVEF